jgi:hypothetical protein
MDEPRWHINVVRVNGIEEELEFGFTFEGLELARVAPEVS